MQKLTAAFLVPVAILCLFSIVVLRSVAPQVANLQLLYFLLGAGLFYLLSRFDYELYTFSPWPWYIAANAILGLTLVLARAIRGSARWIEIGTLNIQTSEVAKPLLVLFAATYLSQKPPRTFKELLKFLGYMVIPTGLIYLQPDLGSSLIILALSLGAVIASGVSLKNLGLLLGIFILLVPVVFLGLKDYQKLRIQSFIDPTQEKAGSGYHAIQSTIAVGSGKILGRGLGQGTQSHLRFLPERQTDFIFASLVEELGFLGGLFLLATYAWASFGLISAARGAKNDTGSIICLTILSILVFQLIINAGMNMGIMPITGITLPLVSSGGSSIISFMILMGLGNAVALRAKSPKSPLEIK